jgi:hypothetical protein
MRIVAGDGVFLNTAFRRLLLAFENGNAALLSNSRGGQKRSAARSKQIAGGTARCIYTPIAAAV